MKFVFLILQIIDITIQNDYNKYEKQIKKLLKNIDKIPKQLVYPPEEFLSNKKIYLPKGINPDKVHMTISIKELKQHKIPIKPAIRICRSLGLTSIVTTPLYTALEEIVGFLPPPFQKIANSKQFKYFLRERLVFFSTLNALKDPKGRVEKAHEDIVEKGMETYQKYEDAFEDLLTTTRNVEYYWNVDKTIIIGKTNFKIDILEHTFEKYEMKLENDVILKIFNQLNIIQMIFVLFFISLYTTQTNKYEKFNKIILDHVKGKNGFIPKHLVFKPSNYPRETRVIILPKWAKVDDVQPPFYKELRQLSPKERNLMIEMMLEMAWMQIKDVANTVVGFLPPIITKILKFPPFYSYLGFMFVWFCFERIGFLKRFGVVKHGYMEKIKNQMAEKAKIYQRQYASYLAQFQNAQISVKSQISQDEEKQLRLTDVIERCENIMDIWESKLKKQIAEVKAKAEIALKHA